jgi:hypothetical protein
VQLEGLGTLKNPMTSSGIEPATFRLVELCLNQLRYAHLKTGKVKCTSILPSKFIKLMLKFAFLEGRKCVGLTEFEAHVIFIGLVVHL